MIQLWAFGKPRIIYRSLKWGEMRDFSISMLLVILVILVAAVIMMVMAVMIPMAIVMLVQFASLFKIVFFTGPKAKTNHKHE